MTSYNTTNAPEMVSDAAREALAAYYRDGGADRLFVGRIMSGDLDSDTHMQMLARFERDILARRLAGWRHEINYGPEGEANYANVYDASGDFVGNLKLRHAIAITAAPSTAGEGLSAQPAPVEGVGWHSPNKLPVIGDKTSANFIVAVKRAHNEKVFVFPAQYLNDCPLWFEDEAEDRNVSGWFGADCDSDEMVSYSPLLSNGDELMGWHDLPAWAALTQSPPPNDAVREALEPVWHWYQSDEHPERPLAEIVADVVADLQQDRAWVLNPPKHKFWMPGEPDCPREIKAGNGELHTLRCKVCGQDNPRDDFCRASSPPPASVDEGLVEAVMPIVQRAVEAAARRSHSVLKIMQGVEPSLHTALSRRSPVAEQGDGRVLGQGGRPFGNDIAERGE